MSDSKVDEKKKSPAQRCVDARPPFNGPHRKIKKSASHAGGEKDPAYVVVVKKERPPDAPPETVTFKYDPVELRSKARGLLKNRNISPDQKKVLEEILGPEENTPIKNK